MATRVMTRTRAGHNRVWDELRRRLRHERARLLRTVTTTEEELDTLERHLPGDAVDHAAPHIETAVLSRLDDQERDEIDEIDAAEERMNAGTYGFCEGCGGSIPVARLRALPTARYCLPCQVLAMP